MMQRPTALGLVLCSQVILDTYTGTRSLIGLFDEVFCEDVPFLVPPFMVYAALTDGEGQIAIDLTVTDIDGEQEILTDSTEAVFLDPLMNSHIRFTVPDLQLPSPGQYLFELRANGEVICHRRLTLIAREEPS